MNPVVPLIAQVAYEVNRSLRGRFGEPAQSGWEEATVWMRESKVWQAELVMDGLSHEEFHQAWYERRFREGWRYGPVDSPALKRSTTMVDFASLDTEQLLKDEAFLTLVRELAPKLLGIQDRMTRLVQRVPNAALMEFIDEEWQKPS